MSATPKSTPPTIYMGPVMLHRVDRAPSFTVLAEPASIPNEPSTNGGSEVANRGQTAASTKLKPIISTSQRLSMTNPGQTSYYVSSPA